MKHPRLFQRMMALSLVFTIVLTVAIASVGATTETATNNRFNVVIVLDASGSMKNTDPSGYRYEAISQFTGLLAERGNVLGGVVFHTGVEAEEVPMLIMDQKGKNLITDMLESVPSNGGWTNTGAGLARAVEMIKSHADPTLPSVILFLSDGNTDMPTKEEINASKEQKAEAIQEARELGIKIYSVCLNANQSADISEMQQLADATGGVFKEVEKAEDLQDVFNAFYNLIYGTSTITLVDEVFPDSGRLETLFDVPGLGVEEVNIIIYGNTTKHSLIRPDKSESTVTAVESDTFTMLKLTDVVPGRWTLITEGVPGDSIKINMVYNTNLDIEVAIAPEEGVINPADPVTITAKLKGNNVLATSGEQYVGYSAELQVMDAYDTFIESIPMEVVNDHFEVKRNFEEGTYYYKVIVTGNHIEKESEKVGPLTSTMDVLTEKEKNNTAPVPVNEVVEASVNIWPFKGGSYTLDMKTLATDTQNDPLRYKIVSSSFIEGTDYTVSTADVLYMDHFSLSKGAFTIRATDTGGLSCDVEVIVRAYNIGMMTLIGIGILAAIGLAVFFILLYIALTKPFRGTISAQSYCNGSYRGTPRSPKRGREKLARFGMDNVGLDYQKCYVQATGQNYIYLVTNQPVIWNGQKTNKVRIQSGAEVTITIREGDSRLLYVRFDSRMRGAPRRPASRGGHRPTQPRRR